MFKLLCYFIFGSSLVHAYGISEMNNQYDHSEDSTIEGKVFVDLNMRGQSINKQFYGSHLDSSLPTPQKTIMDELRIGKLRIGGNEYDLFNWKNKMSARSNGTIIQLNGFESIASDLKKLNIDGIFQINLTGYQPELFGKSYVVKRSFNASSAYDMVKHLNGKLKLNIKDFSLGNEFSIWHETHSVFWDSKDGISADEYIDRYIDYAIAIRKAQKEISGDANSIKIWGPEISSSWLDWNTGNYSKDCSWSNIPNQVECTYGIEKFTNFIPYFFYRLSLAEKDKKLNPAGFKLLDYFSIHYYPNFRTKINDPFSVISDSKGNQLIAEMIESTRNLHDPHYINQFDRSSYKNYSPNILGRIKIWIKNYYPNVKLAINEFAVDSDYRSNSYHPIIRPLYMADSIGIFASHGVSYFNQFILNSEKSFNSPWAMIVNGNEKQNLFFMYKLFSNYFTGVVLRTDDSFGDSLNTYATSDGAFTSLAIVNKNPIEKLVKIYFSNGTTKKIANYLAPAWSSSILRIDNNPNNQTKLFKAFQFGAKEMGISIKINNLEK